MSTKGYGASLKRMVDRIDKLEQCDLIIFAFYPIAMKREGKDYHFVTVVFGLELFTSDAEHADTYEEKQQLHDRLCWGALTKLRKYLTERKLPENFACAKRIVLEEMQIVEDLHAIAKATSYADLIKVDRLVKSITEEGENVKITFFSETDKHFHFKGNEDAVVASFKEIMSKQFKMDISL